VFSSLRGLPLDARALALVRRILEAGPSRLPLLRNACAVIAAARALQPQVAPRPVPHAAASEPMLASALRS